MESSLAEAARPSLLIAALGTGSPLVLSLVSKAFKVETQTFPVDRRGLVPPAESRNGACEEALSSPARVALHETIRPPL